MIYTFYSFKGGVGRSMTLAGAAYLFAERGLRVLAIDFDLEAPGLERYYFERTAARDARQRPGIIDLILTYKRALTSPGEFEKATFKQWRNFCVDAVPSTAAGGSVHLMLAGCREPEEKLRSYAQAVRSFDWQDFFDNWSGAQFFTWLRKQLTDPQGGYDVVLVDSRTGVTEMGGVCAYQLADVAVMLCAANYQNLEGTLAVSRDFRSDAVLALRSGRPLEILVLPARLEQSHPRRTEFMDEFARTFASEGLPKVLADARLNYAALALPYDPGYAVAERLVGDTAENDVSALKSAGVLGFAKLCDALTLLASEGKLVSQQPQALGRLMGQNVDPTVLPLADVTKGSAGFDAFFDYAASDRDVAQQLVQGLRSAGISVYDPADSAPNADIAETLETALQYSEWLLVLVSTHTSRPREALLRKARERGKPRLLPLLLPGAADSQLASFGLEHVQSIALSDALPAATSAAVANIVTALKTRQQRAAGDVVRPNPYPGDRPFKEDDAPLFFGRDAEVQALLEALQSHDVLLITGASGVGKTSMLRAGLLPKLRVTTAEGPWEIEVVDFAAGNNIPTPSPTSSTAPATKRRSLLILDGVDTFLEDGDEAARRRRITDVVYSVTAESARRKVLICGRGTWSEEDERPIVEGMFRYEIQPLAAASLRDVIERPAQAQRHLFEGGLVDRLITDAGTSGAALPLLQLVLPTLWQERRRGWLTNHAYDRLGTVNGAVRRRKDAFYATLSLEDRRRATLFMSNLVSLDSSLALVPDQCAWRRLGTIPALGPDVSSLRDRLVDQRLVVAAHRGNDLYCALAASDAGACLDPGDINAEFMLWRQRFSTFLQPWRTARSLIHEPSLGEAQRWLDLMRDELSEDERSLIEASAESSAQSQRAAQQQRALEQARELIKDEQARREDYRAPRAPEPEDNESDLRQQGNQVLARMKSTGDAESLSSARDLVRKLMAARDYEFAALVLETACRQDPRDSGLRRRYAQCSIESGRVIAAIDMLSQLIHRLPPEDPEREEASGLLGRAHKQIFLDAVDPSSVVAKHALRDAIEAYDDVYKRNPRSAWHGVNLAALLHRADRLGVRAGRGVTARRVASSVIATIEATPPHDRGVWDLATLAEAHLAQGDWDAAEQSLREYVASPDVTSFEINSLLRQLTRVWDLESTGSRGAGLVATLRAALLQLEGAQVDFAANDLSRLQAEQSPQPAQLEAVLGPEGARTFAWWRTGLARAQGVAALRLHLADRVGTGFLVNARELGLPEDELVLLTVAHAISAHPIAGAIGPEATEVVFEAANPSTVYRVSEILWESPVDLLDACVLRLSPRVSGIAPLPLAQELPEPGQSRVYLIGHPGGRELSFSLSDAHLIDHEGPPAGRPQIPGVCRVHYQTHTEGGSSGSPVFNSTSWQVIAIHHKSQNVGMPRLNGVQGTYAAKEGIWIQSIVQAIASSKKRGKA